MALALAGAGDVRGLDPYLQIDETFRGADTAPIANAVLAAESFCASTGTTPEVVDARAAAVRSDGWPIGFAATDGVVLPAPDASADVVISKSTLEHVRRTDVGPLLSELHRIVKPGGLMAHMIDLRDHMHINNDAVHGDWLEALRYSDRLFDAMFSRRSTSINRLRRVEWRSAFAEAGFDVIGEWPVVLALPDGFRRERLHARWRELPEDELAVAQVLMALRPAS
jgi:SAM-dependent methyltransferase